jgi:hypothetical protein
MDVMNVLALLIVGGPLVAVAVVGGPAMATASAPTMATHPVAMGHGSPLRLASNDDFTTRKDAYVRKSGDEMTEWRNKIHAAGERAEAKGHEASAETKDHFNRAWAETEEGWRKLQAESAEGWDNTKNAYEKSTAELRAQWHKIHPED